MTSQGLIKNRQFVLPQATPSAQHSSRIPIPSYPKKLPGIVSSQHCNYGKTEDAEPFHPLDLFSITNTPAILRARSHSTASSHSTISCSDPASTSAPALSGVLISPEDTDIITDANFTARRHTRANQCLAHPMTVHASPFDKVSHRIASGIAPCDCEVVQRPTVSQQVAWTIMARRFKAVQDAWRRNDLPPLCAPRAPIATGANALQEHREREEDSHRAHAPHAYDHRSSHAERDRHVAKTIDPINAHARARRSCPVVLAVPSRVVAHARAAVARDARRMRDARDVIERRRANPYNTERVPGGHRHRGV